MTEVALMKSAGDSGSVGIAPGKPDESHLIVQITPDASGQAEMPKSGKPLVAAELALVRRWIAEGAHDDTPASAGQRIDKEHPPVYSRPPVITSLEPVPEPPGSVQVVVNTNCVPVPAVLAFTAMNCPVYGAVSANCL